MQAKIGGREVVVGKFAFVNEHAPDAARTTIAPGELAVYVAIDGRYAGALLASDRLRSNARATLERLDTLGVHQTMMLTGDAQATADHIASDLGITRVRADCLPADKVHEVSARTCVMPISAAMWSAVAFASPVSIIVWCTPRVSSRSSVARAFSRNRSLASSAPA